MCGPPTSGPQLTRLRLFVRNCDPIGEYPKNHFMFKVKIGPKVDWTQKIEFT